jgi:hypothetical protein
MTGSGFEDAWTELAAALARFDGRTVAEQLATLGRFGDAGEAEAIERPTHLAPTHDRPRGLAVTVEDSEEHPRFVPETGDAQRLLDLFGGASHAYMRDVKVGERTERQRMMQPLSLEQSKAHLAGTYWLGVYPLRENHSVYFAAVRVVESSKNRADKTRASIPQAVTDDARRVGQALVTMALHRAGPSPVGVSREVIPARCGHGRDLALA